MKFLFSILLAIVPSYTLVGSEQSLPVIPIDQAKLEGLKLGMSLEEFKESRPELKPSLSGKTKINYLEKISESTDIDIIAYSFENDKLKTVSISKESQPSDIKEYLEKYKMMIPEEARSGKAKQVTGSLEDKGHIYSSGDSRYLLTERQPVGSHPGAVTLVIYGKDSDSMMAKFYP